MVAWNKIELHRRKQISLACHPALQSLLENYIPPKENKKLKQKNTKTTFPLPTQVRGPDADFGPVAIADYCKVDILCVCVCVCVCGIGV
jgi:hypothetical protein